MKIAIISDSDTIWSLAAWRRAIPGLQNSGHEIVGFWNCPNKLANIKNKLAFLYYLKTFGVYNFVKLGLFSVFCSLKRALLMLRWSQRCGFVNLCRENGVSHLRCIDPNDSSVVDWMRKQCVDIIIITIGFILKEQILSTPNFGIINKHAALLPANRGVFPYLWAKIHNQIQGISFHRVTQEVDGGELLAQEFVDNKDAESMVNFYYYVFAERFAGMLITAVNTLIGGQCIHPLHSYPASYHGLPHRREYVQFKKCGGEIIRLKDIFLAWRL